MRYFVRQKICTNVPRLHLCLWLIFSHLLNEKKTQLESLQRSYSDLSAEVSEKMKRYKLFLNLNGQISDEVRVQVTLSQSDPKLQSKYSEAAKIVERTCKAVDSLRKWEPALNLPPLPSPNEE